MALDSINDNDQLSRNLLIGCAQREQPENLTFSLTQRVLQHLGYSRFCNPPGLRFMDGTLPGKGGEHYV